jgi:signal transduction histidine kinase
MLRSRPFARPGTGLLRGRAVEAGWVLFAAANLAAMIVWPHWETVPFHFIWVSLTLVYGIRVWPGSATHLALALVALATAAVIADQARKGDPTWQEMFEVPLMSAMFLAIVWHARRRQAVLDAQQRFLNDASHDLRTPVTIARGHLELLRRDGTAGVDVALSELTRIERLTERPLLLARAEQPTFFVGVEIDVEQFLEDLFVRWVEVAPRAWRLRNLAAGTLSADPEALRTALDALLENAVRHTGEGDAIEIAARSRGRTLALEIGDEGPGIPPGSIDHIFDRFARADPSRSRAQGGAGRGLAIVQAIAAAHRGRCAVRSSPAGTTFALELPHFRAEPQARRSQDDGRGDGWPRRLG